MQCKILSLAYRPNLKARTKTWIAIISHVSKRLKEISPETASARIEAEPHPRHVILSAGAEKQRKKKKSTRLGGVLFQSVLRHNSTANTMQYNIDDVDKRNKRCAASFLFLWGKSLLQIPTTAYPSLGYRFSDFPEYLPWDIPETRFERRQQRFTSR